MRDDDDEQYFTADRQRGEGESFPSLSGRYTLTISEYRTKPEWGDYSRGIVRDKEGNGVVDVKRNYGAFPFCFVEHPNGHEYLVCGEDYQGQTVVELDTGKRVDYVPPEAQEGLGFCWAAIESASPHRPAGQPSRAAQARIAANLSHPHQIDAKLPH